MDEHDKSLEELSETTTTSLKERFKGFALYHIRYSFAFVAFLLLALFVLAQFTTSWAPNAPDPGHGSDTSVLPLIILEAICMLLYFPLGMLAAKRGRWTVPSRREKLLAIAQPCVVSISWVLLLLLSKQLGVLVLENICVVLSCLFAAPSSFFSFFFTAIIFFCGIIPGRFVFFAAPLLSAILPPLLFGLGSFWQAKRQNSSQPT